MDITEVSFHYPPTSWGGAESYAHQIGVGLKGAGHRVRVVTSSRSPKGSRKYNVHGLKVGAYPTAYRFPASVITRTWNPVAWFRNYGKGAVAHVHNVVGFSPLIFRALRRGHTATVWTAHDPTYMCGARMLPRDGSKCQGIGSRKCKGCENSLDRLRRSMVRRHLLPNVDALVPTSLWMRGLMVDAGFPKEKMTVITNGIDMKNIPRSRVPKEPVIMFCGRVEPSKGLIDALDAYEIVLEDVPDASFNVVGDGPQLVDARKYAKARGLPRVMFTGRVPSANPYYKEARVVILPSIIPENCSLVLLEAHAFGRPSVCTRVGGNIEIVHPGETGLMTDPGDPADMACQLIKVLSSISEANRMGRNARVRAERHFKMELKVQDHTRLFNRLVEK